MSIEQLLKKVQCAGEKHGGVLYEILFRNAGVGIFWYEAARHQPMTQHEKLESGNYEEWRKGLVVYGYKRTLREALRWELRRLQTVRS